MAEQTELLSHWLQHFEGLTQSSQQFYSMVEKRVSMKQISDVKFARVDFKEGGLFSDSREYLRIKRGDLRYDIGGAPFGNGFFVSARLFAEGKFADEMIGSLGRGGLLANVAGAVTAKVIGSHTYMRVDQAHMYLQLVHRGLLEAVDAMSSAANLPTLPEPERRPVMKAFFH